MSSMREMLAGVEIPHVAKVRQMFPQPVLERDTDILMAQLKAKNLGLRPGQRIAITGGSRGIAGYQRLMQTIVRFVKEQGAEPFIVPAMGSHGQGTAKGQEVLLAHLGITEAAVGAPIVSSMETVEIGQTDLGLPVYIDRQAYEADGIILFNRVKTHTSIRGPYQSGLVKMLAIGLAKHRGAAYTHRLGIRNLPENILRVGRIGLEKLKIVAGIATVENSLDALAEIHVLKREEILSEEPKILERATALVPIIHLDEIDALIVTEFGKEISGNGVDPAVVGRPTNDLPNPGPTVHALGVLRLTKKSDGNASGLGLADFIPRQFRKELNEQATYVNCTTGCNVKLARIPITVDTERDVIRACLRVCGVPSLADQKLVLIRSTKFMDEVYMSKAAVAAAHQDKIEVMTDYRAIEFDPNGRLTLF